MFGIVSVPSKTCANLIWLCSDSSLIFGEFFSPPLESIELQVHKVPCTSCCTSLTTQHNRFPLYLQLADRIELLRRRLKKHSFCSLCASGPWVQGQFHQISTTALSNHGLYRGSPWLISGQGFSAPGVNNQTKICNKSFSSPRSSLSTSSPASSRPRGFDYISHPTCQAQNEIPSSLVLFPNRPDDRHTPL